MISMQKALARRLGLVFSAAIFLGFAASLLAYQRRGFNRFQQEEDDSKEMPVGARQRVEWTFARFHYNMGYGGGFGRGFRRWAADYPKSDRQLVQGVVRLTRINTHVAEQVVDANSDDIYNWRVDFHRGSQRLGAFPSRGRSHPRVSLTGRVTCFRRYSR